jgi:hypothetical protein
MSIIFLDIDGVLNNTNHTLYMSSTVGRSHGLPLDPVSIWTLNEILMLTGSNIVISSSWRIIKSLDSLRVTFRKNGINGNLVGVTPHVAGMQRGQEIEQYVHVHEVKNFVIIDDSSDMEPYMDKLVQTDTRYGLRPLHIEAVTSLLEKEGS